MGRTRAAASTNASPRSPGDLVLEKENASAFFGTHLAPYLIGHGVDTLLITGCSTSACIRATATDAKSYRFRPIIVRECVGDRSPVAHEWTLFDIQARFADVVPLGRSPCLRIEPGCARRRPRIPTGLEHDLKYRSELSPQGRLGDFAAPMVQLRREKPDATPVRVACLARRSRRRRRNRNAWTSPGTFGRFWSGPAGSATVRKSRKAACGSICGPRPSVVGDSGSRAITPGKADESELIRRVEADDVEERMPPKSDPLSRDEIRILRAWIDQGADWPETAAAAAERSQGDGGHGRGSAALVLSAAEPRRSPGRPTMRVGVALRSTGSSSPPSRREAFARMPGQTGAP